MRKTVLVLLCGLALVAGLGLWLLWPRGGDATSPGKNAAAHGDGGVAATATAVPAAPPKTFSTLNLTNPLAFRLTNTAQSLRQLAAKPHAILLQNALIDTDARLDLPIPAHLKAAGQPGAYIVQARGVVDGAFRSLLTAAGASVVSYIPNNAYLVNATVAQAGALAGSPLVQVVLPFEPYYKLQPALLGLAVNEQPLPPGTALNLGLFAADATATEKELLQLRFKTIKQDRSAFGPVLTVLAPVNWTQVAQVSGVQAVEVSHQRRTANDLSRVTLGVTPDTTSGTNNDWLGLTGLNVLVAVNDTGIDATNNPDLAGRVSGLDPADTMDVNGHGTFVAGQIASSGAHSLTPPDVGQFAEGSVTNADFRGKAPAATLFAMNYGQADYVLQANAAQQGALISNNSWDNGDPQYDLAASSYDAATRDALPFSTGSQPVLFVFAAGGAGGGNDNGAGGSGDTIMSPGTAKNVITVGALEQLRNITNLVTTITAGIGTNAPTTNQVAYWLLATDSGAQVAGYSSRGNVGIGTEGAYGRFKPDVVAPGTFVVSTRSSQWDTNAYFNPTNVSTAPYTGQLVTTNALNYYNVSVPPNAVGVTINITANKYSPNPFPNLPIYASQSGVPTTADFVGSNSFAIPPGGNSITLASIQNSGFGFAVGDSTNVPVNYDLTVAISTTNNVGDYYQVLEGMDDQLGPYYRYESGTSMSAADVSGVLALMQDYFTNTLKLTPSPALLKAMLINGARTVGSYSLAVTNGVNFQGWGLPNLANSLPLATNAVIPIGPNPTLNSPLFFVDQSPTNALATGDRHTYTLTIDTNSYANYLQLQATLVWTDPPGDPNAAIKLVNGLTLVITNLDTGDVYYGNDISSDLGFNLPWDTNGPPNLDTINNVQNILLPPLLAGSYSVTVLGRSVNVNAVTAQTNNTVQDFALVVSVGEGEVPTAILSAVDNNIVSNPTGDQNITFVTVTNTPLMNQFAGENTPLLGTNNLPLGTNTVWGPNGLVTIGMTNQWHFYVVTNNALDAQGNSADVTNAAFITFNADTLAIPRVGVFADSTANATRPEADIDVYVSTDPSLTNLNPAVISNCLAGTVTATANSYGASLGQGGTEFVVFSNSAPGQVYYVGVKSEDHMAAEYDFLAVFTSVPFSTLDKNGNQIVNGMLLPVNIPDGNNAHPGVANVFALAIYPMQVDKVIVTNWNEHQNFGDLFGSLSYNGVYTVLNNHDGLGNTYSNSAATLVYDDSRNPIAGSQRSDGPGSLMNFRAKSTPGLFLLTEMDNAQTQTGRVSVLTLKIQPHRNLTGGAVTVTVPAHGWFVDYVDVPPGYTNLTFYGTNIDIPPVSPPIQMYEKLGNEPMLTDYDQEADLTNCLTGTYPTGTYPGNSISVGPPLDLGRYFIGLYNPGYTDASVLLSATLGFGSGANNAFSYASGTATPLPDDAVSTSTITVPNTVTQLVASVSVGLVVNSPRISDYTFTLVSPTGQRVLLMENRGGPDTNGAGAVFVYTNILNTTASGNGNPNTNYLGVSILGETVPVTYDFYTVPDEMTVYGGTNPATFFVGSPDFLYDTGFTNNPTGPATFNVNVPPGYTNITIIMNQFGNPYSIGGDAWDYTAGAPMTNFEYLVFTDDTNLANVPIKFAPPPFSFTEVSSNFTLSDFELATNGDYFAPTNIYDAFGGWNLPTNLVMVSTVFNTTNNAFVPVTNVVIYASNEVSVVADPSDSVGDNVGTNLLALADGTITRNLVTVPGRIYNVTFWYRGPGIASWWRGEGDAIDSSDPEKNANNGTLVGRFNFPAGEVGQAFGFLDAGQQFQFAGTNTYVQIPQSTSLDVGKGGGFTVEGWINPTNVAPPQPLVEWLAKTPTNTADTNFVRLAGPYLDRDTGHYYYLLGATNWTTSERWATLLGGHLATVDTANEQNWIFDNFANYGGTNHNLWIGLTNNLPTIPTTFVWSSGLTNIAYTNWLTGQPTNSDGTRKYTFIRGETNQPSGLWVCANNNGFTQTAPVSPTNIVYGVVEVDNLQTNGVQFWVSVTNSMPGGTNTLVSSNGCLYANLIDTSNLWHEVYSAPGLIQSNVFQHVALTFDTNSGLAKLYLNGTNVATTNLFMIGSVFTPFVPRTDGDVLLGRDMTLCTNNYFGGEMDEMSIYKRALSDAEIAAIYRVSTTASNGLTGKFDASVTPASGLAEAEVVFGTTSNLIFGVNNQWEQNSYTFTAASNTMPLRITGMEPGILLDSFAVSQAPLTNLCYLPEQSLNDAFTGGQANGNWTLQVWDNRVGAYVTNFSSLVSWQLNFILASNAQISASLSPQTPTPSTVGPGTTVYYEVDVPSWAQWATNILVSSTLPVDMLFNPTNLPTGSNPGDITLLTGSFGGIPAGVSPVLAVNTNAPFAPYQAGTTYYLGVRNSGTHAASVVLEVDYDLTALTNGIPYTSRLNTNEAVRYFSYVVNSNAYAATFQLLNLTNGNADLVLRKGVPLPTLTSSDYGSFNATNADENIYVLTNSSPVPLSAGTWYLGVIRRSTGPVGYSVLAKELDTTNSGSMDGATIIELTNGVPVNFTAGPGAALTNFFHFAVTNMVVNGVTNRGLRFELYNLSGNGDLTVQTNALPLAPPFFESSQNPGRSPELITVYTNNVLTNLVADWYLGVPNHELTNISYTIVAMIDTNGYFPAFPGAEGTGGGAFGGGRLGYSNTVYHVFNLNDSGVGSLRDAVSSTNRTVVFDVSGTIWLQSRLVITNSFLTLAGQTAPGDGITVAGWETSVTNAHDVIIRYLRFRPGSAALPNLLNLDFNGGTGVISPKRGTAAIGYTTNDLWNLYSRDDGFGGFKVAGTVPNLLWSDGTASGINLYITNAPGAWGNGSGDYMFNIYLYPLPNGNGNIVFTLSNVPPGKYDLYLYSHGGSTENGSLNVQVGAANYGVKTTAAGAVWSNPQVWQQGQQYVVFSGVVVSSLTDVVNVTVAPVSIVAPINGLQMVQSSAVGIGSQGDALRFITVSNVIVDHVTATWAQRQVLSAIDSTNLTVQWSVMAEQLYSDSTNGQFDGSQLRLGHGALSFHHNLYANNDAGSPHLQDDVSLDFVNNVIYNWGTNSGSSFFNPTNNPNGFTNQLNYTCNYLIAGSNSFQPWIAFHSDTTNTWIFQTNNFIDSDTNGVLNGGDTQWAMFTNQYTKLPQPLPLVRVGTDEARFAYEKVLAFAGTSLLQRDSADTNLVTGVRQQTGQIITSQNQVGGWPVLNTTPLLLDSDQDGIPDYWEITFGQNPTNASGYLPSTHSPGYTDLEEYLNWLAAPHALTVTNTSVAVDLYKLSGNSGHLTFFVTNAVNGTVYLTNVLYYTNYSGVVIGPVTNTGPWSNSFAIFTPTNTSPAFSGYASFDYYITNNDTVAYFGPVTVSVVVSATNIMLSPTIIDLTNNIPVPFTAGPGPALTNFFRYVTTNSPGAIQFRLYGQSGNGDLVLQTNALPFAPPYYASSQQPGNSPESILVTTNSTLTNLNNVVWYLGVPNNDPTMINFTIVATEIGAPPIVLTNAVPVTNTVPAGWTQFYLVNVPINADFATNLLLFTTNGLPLNVWFSTNVPPTIHGSSDSLLIASATNGSSVLGTNTSPPLVPGSFYYLGVENTNGVDVTYGIEVIFHLLQYVPYATTEPATLVTGTNAQLNGMATANTLPGTAWFQYGLSTAYGSNTPPVALTNGYNVVFLTNAITGLVPNQPYHFRLVVSNAYYVTYGFDQILDQANVVAWGANFIGQTTLPGRQTNMVAIAAGYDFSLDLSRNGTVATWGDNNFGQTNVPLSLTNVVAVAGGWQDCLALRSDRTLTVWGNSLFGQTNVTGLSNVIAAAYGHDGNFWLALNADGTVKVRGYNGSGQTNVPAGLSNVVAVAGGSLHCLALNNDGTVTVWGYNGDGETNVPAGLSNVVAIAAGDYHSLALKADGTVAAWGLDSDGQIDVPVGLSNVVAVAGGGYHSLALKSDGTVVSWGYNGDGETTNMPVGLTNVVAIAAGGFHSLALTSLSNLGHTPPFWPTNLPSQTVLELSNLTFNVAATNANNPPDIMTYQLTNAPVGMTINTNTGDVSWTPTEAQGPGIYSNITVIATANGLPPLSGTNSFTVTVLEVNTAPFWPTNVPSQTNYAINALNTLIVSDTATDTDIPVNPLFYKLIIPPGGTNAAISTNTGIFTWTPSLAQVSSNLYTFMVIVTDTNAYALTNQSLSNTNYIYVQVLPPLAPTNGAPQTNTLAGGGVAYYLFNVPTNADYATNRLLFASNGPVNVWFSTNLPPTITNSNDFLLITNASSGSPVLGTNTLPRIVPGSFYYLAVQNPNSVAVTYALEVDFHLVTALSPVTISSIVQTNIGTTNGFLLTWFAPSNDLFQVQWTPTLAPVNWTTFTNPPSISFNPNIVPVNPTNAQFNFFDDGTQTGGFGPTRFYRLILLQTSTNTLTLPAQANFSVSNNTAMVTVTNTATDSRSGAVLTYRLTNSPAGASISTNGIIIWTNATPSGLAARFTTLVSDDSVPPLTATNTFAVFVAPFPAITNITVTATNTTLAWLAPTNDQFQVQWTTNLAPPVNWMLFSNGVSPVIITSTNGSFTFVDTNALFLAKFYQLILLP
jgi:subtilisin-like proprotein convertase family protein